MLIRPAIGDTDPIRYRRPTPDGQFSGNIIDEAMRSDSLLMKFERRLVLVSQRNQHDAASPTSIDPGPSRV
jgi:hypothetical protein